MDKEKEATDNEDDDDSEDESEYEEIVEYMMVEMRVANTSSFPLHRHKKCVLKNMFSNNKYPSIELETKRANEPEEYVGEYCDTPGTQIFYKQEVKNENINNNNNNNNDNNKDIFELFGSSDKKCVFSRFKSPNYPIAFT